MADQGKKAHQQLASSLSLRGSDADFIIYCQPCDRDGPRLSAHGYCKNCCEHLCECCFNHHKKHTLSRDHILQDKMTMPQTLQPHPGRQQVEVTRPCPKHKKEAIKYFCHDHESLICNVCVTLEHQSSTCSVKYIPDISENVVDGKEYQDLLKTIESISIQFCKMKDEFNDSYKKSNMSLKNVLINIKELRKEINQRIDVLEMQAEGRLKDIQNENAINLKKVEIACSEANSSLLKSSETIKQLNATKQADDLFIEVKYAQQMLACYEKTLADLSNSDVQEYEFKTNETITANITKDKSLGTLVHKSLRKKRRTAASQAKSRHFSYRREICVKTTKDEKMCCISGMAFLSPDLLIITDDSNKAVKMVNTSSRSVTDQLQLTFSPNDITKITCVELAVTLPYLKEIQLISVISNKLTKSRKFTVDGTCYGISCHQDKLVVSFTDPAQIQIIDLNGTALRTFGDGLLKKPYYVVTNSLSIYVSDWKMETVTKFNWQGEMDGSYGDAGLPKGLVVSGDGNVFVCDKNRNDVKEISGDCSTGNVALKDLNSPNALSLCTDSNELCYSCNSEIPTNANLIYIYKLS